MTPSSDAEPREMVEAIIELLKECISAGHVDLEDVLAALMSSTFGLSYTMNISKSSIVDMLTEMADVCYDHDDEDDDDEKAAADDSASDDRLPGVAPHFLPVGRQKTRPN